MTIKWNIKFDMGNLTHDLITRHTLPTRICFIIFSHHTKYFKFYFLRTLHTFTLACQPKGKAKRVQTPTPYFAIIDVITLSEK